MPIVDGINFQTYQEETLLPVILMHGAGGNYLSWPPEIRRIPGYRVYALDLPGHGKSSRHVYQSIKAKAQAVVDWMGAVDLHRAVFVGHSMGGAIALQVALDYPNQVLGLGLLGAAGRMRVNPGLLENAAREDQFENVINTIIDWSFGELTPFRLKELVGKRMALTRPSVLYADLTACDAFDVRTRLGEIDQPALVICGEEDKMTPLRHARYLADTLPNGRLYSIPGAGHMVMLEQPEVCANLLSEFLGSIRY